MAATGRIARDRRTIVALGAVGAGVLLLLQARDPHGDGAYATCPFLALTGWWCPLCGGLRATHDLTRLQFVDAVSSNVLATVLVVAAGGYFLYWASRRWRGFSVRTVVLGARSMLALVVVVLAFTIVRNLAFGALLAP